MTRPEVEALHRALAEQLALGFLGHEGALCPMDDGALYVRGCIRLAPLVDAVLAAQWRPNADARPIAAAIERLTRTKAGTRSIADHITFGLYYWNAAGEERNGIAELALDEATAAALKEYLLRQPMDRTAREMLDDFYPPAKETSPT